MKRCYLPLTLRYSDPLRFAGMSLYHRSIPIRVVEEIRDVALESLHEECEVNASSRVLPLRLHDKIVRHKGDFISPERLCSLPAQVVIFLIPPQFWQVHLCHPPGFHPLWVKRCKHQSWARLALQYLQAIRYKLAEKHLVVP